MTPPRRLLPLGPRQLAPWAHMRFLLLLLILPSAWSKSSRPLGPPKVPADGLESVPHGNVLADDLDDDADPFLVAYEDEADAVLEEKPHHAWLRKNSDRASAAKQNVGFAIRTRLPKRSALDDLVRARDSIKHSLSGIHTNALEPLAKAIDELEFDQEFSSDEDSSPAPRLVGRGSADGESAGRGAASTQEVRSSRSRSASSDRAVRTSRKSVRLASKRRVHRKSSQFRGGDAGASDKDAAVPVQPDEHSATETTSTDEVVRAVERLKERAKRSGAEGDWAKSARLYEEACEALLESASADGDEAEALLPERLAGQLQACRLNLALCLTKQSQWDDAARVCSDVIQANPRCGTAFVRRAKALEESGKYAAALWDLQRAAKLLPNSEQVANALARVESSERRAKRERRAQLGAGSAGAERLPDMASLFSSLTAGSAGGSPSGEGAGGLMSMLAGLGGASGGDAGDTIEQLLRSPLLGGDKAGGLMGLIGTALSCRRRVKQFWKAAKPYLPLLFYLVLLLPAIHALLTGRFSLF